MLFKSYHFEIWSYHIEIWCRHIIYGVVVMTMASTDSISYFYDVFSKLGPFKKGSSTPESSDDSEVHGTGKFTEVCLFVDYFRPWYTTDTWHKTGVHIQAWSQWSIINVTAPFMQLQFCRQVILKRQFSFIKKYFFTYEWITIFPVVVCVFDFVLLWYSCSCKPNYC